MIRSLLLPAALLALGTGLTACDTASPGGSTPTPPVVANPYLVARAGANGTLVPAFTDVTFTAAGSTAPNGAVYEWTFWDNTTARGEAVVKRVPDVGAYRARLSITNGQGQRDTASVVVQAKPPLRIVTSGGTGTPATPLTFRVVADSTLQLSTPLRSVSEAVAWTFSDGGTASTASVDRWVAAASVTATATVTRSSGAVQTVSSVVQNPAGPAEALYVGIEAYPECSFPGGGTFEPVYCQLPLPSIVQPVYTGSTRYWYNASVLYSAVMFTRAGQTTIVTNSGFENGLSRTITRLAPLVVTGVLTIAGETVEFRFDPPIPFTKPVLSGTVSGDRVSLRGVPVHYLSGSSLAYQGVYVTFKR